MVTAPPQSFGWSLPRGFLAFGRESAGAPDWAHEEARRLAAGAPSAEFERALAETVDRCLAKPEQPDSWLAVVARPTPSTIALVGSGWVTFGSLVDVEEIAAGWAAEYAREGAQPGEVLLVSSRRAPAVIARDVVLGADEDGRPAYVERGVIVKSFTRVGVTGMLSFSTRNLAAFEDLMHVLKDAVGDFQVQEATDG